MLININIINMNLKTKKGCKETNPIMAAASIPSFPLLPSPVIVLSSRIMWCVVCDDDWCVICDGPVIVMCVLASPLIGGLLFFLSSSPSPSPRVSAPKSANCLEASHLVFHLKMLVAFFLVSTESDCMSGGIVRIK